MHIEMYSPSDARRIAALRQETQAKTDPGQWLLEELGFNHLLSFIPKPTNQLDELFDRLTPEEANAWQWLLVKRWSRNSGSWRRFHEEIPFEVVQAIPEVRSLFDDLEIWVPHRDSNGFLLVGVVYDPTQEPTAADNFMIARWANGQLGLSFDELREDVVEIGQNREQHARQARYRFLAWAMVLGIVLVMLLIVLQLH